jgi:GNAT superfamily N-acetyltransferase
MDFWHAFAHQRGLELIGPGVHRYIDDDPGRSPNIRQVEPSALLAMCDDVTEEELWESGFDEALDEPGVIAFATDGAGAVLRQLGGAPRNVAVLVAAHARGRGLATDVGRAAASYAVRHHGYARWRCRDTNVPSARAAARIGFEPYATQLALRPVSAG